jgi:excisionase family DNA binding protein
MTSAVLERGPVFAQETEAPAIRELELALARRDPAEPLLLSADQTPHRLPATVAQLLAHLVHELAKGNAVTIVPVHAELTTFQAAELLNVSRPYLVRLLDQGKIPFHRVGTHRRIYAADLLAYRERRRAEQHRMLDEMAQEAQAMGLYHAEPPVLAEDD